ncbi:hypothetical protein JHD46_08605, partial [Sulfurimonas sp. SAG-AH-194-C20]
MIYSEFDKTLTIRVSDYKSMIKRIYSKYEYFLSIATDLDSKIDKGINTIDLSHPNISWEIGGTVDLGSRTINTSFNFSTKDNNITVEYSGGSNVTPSGESMMILSVSDKYIPFLKQKIIDKKKLFSKTNWRYSSSVASIPFSSLSGESIPSLRQAIQQFHSVASPSLGLAIYKYSGTRRGNSISTKEFTIDEGNLLSSLKIYLNSPTIFGDTFKINGSSIYSSSSPVVKGDRLSISRRIAITDNSIISDEEAESIFSLKNIENVDTLYIKEDRTNLSQYSAIIEGDISSIMTNKMLLSVPSLPYSSKVYSSALEHIVSDKEIMNILKSEMQTLYSSLILRGEDTDSSKIRKLIDDRIDELKAKFAEIQTCSSFQVTGEDKGCMLTDEDFRALKPKRLVEKWLMKQILKRGLIYEN